MADERLIFPVGFDLDAGVKDASKEWQRISKEMQAAIDSRPMNIKIDTHGIEKFQTFVDRVYASIEDLQKMFPEVFKESKDGENITKQFQAMETSINAVNAEMRNLEKVWNNLSMEEKFDDKGQLTERAQELKRAYVELYQSQRTQGQTLQEITKEAIRLADQEIAKAEQKKAKEAEYLRLLNLEENTLDNIRAKQGALMTKLNATEIGTNEWKETVAEVQRLDAKMKELQISIKGVSGKVKEVKKEKIDIDTSSFTSKLRDLEKRWKALTAAQRKGAEGEALRKEWRELSAQAGNYASTLRSAVSAQDRLAKSQEKSVGAIKAQNAEYHKQSSYISRLIQRLGIYTSIYAAAGMLRDIRETTAEFELQEVALGAIIQDAHEAQVLFSQIKAAAVESPYQIKELVDYTKQLAAYGFEQNELFNTTMKLADISAGLGADMSRIILAVGQISAATVLKGTELRQLTELGIPMVELLAKKFTQLRGEVVTTGEVFEMISDKAVSFKMVEEILNDLTSAGGMFYDMQRKQAETLAGQWSNLKDSIAIAYDEIGNTGTVRGAMEGWISTVKSLVENWRIVGSVIGGAVSSFAGVKLAALFIPRLVVDTQMLAKAINDSALAQQRYNAAQAGSFAQKSARWARLQAVYMRKAAFATTAFSRSWYKLAASMAGGGWISIAVTAITVLVSWFISARKEANRLNEEINRIGSESELQADQSVRNFERLANAAANAADGTKEQADALSELHRSYRDVIPVQDMTIDKLREMQGEYKSLTDAIKEKIAMQAKEQKISTIISELGGDISDRESDVRGFLKDSGLSSAEVSAVMDEIKTAVDKGLIDTEADVTEQARQIEKIIFDTTGRVVDVVRRAYVQVAGTNQRVLQFRSTRLSRNILKLVDLYTNLNDRLKDVEDSADKATGKMGDYGKMFETLQTSLSGVVGEGEQYSFEWNESILRQKVALYKSTIEDILGNEKINYKIGDNIDFAEIGKAISSATPQLKNAIAEIEKEYNKLVPTDRMSKVIKDKFMEVAESTGASMDALQGYLKNADTSVTDWAKSIEEAVSSTEKKLNEMTFTNRQIEAGLGGPLRPYDEQEIDSTTNKLTALKTILEWISSFLTTQKTTPPDNRLRDLNEEVSLLEKVYAKYKEFLKYMSSADAKAKTEEYFADTIDSLRFGAAFDTTKLKEILTKYQDAARSLPESDKTVLELGFKVDDVSWQETLDDMKDRVAELADAVARSKEAKDFYDKMLGMTGDRQLSADLTMSVYGGVGDDLKENIKRQLTEAFKDVDISSAFDGDNIDYKKLEALIPQLPEDLRSNARKLVEDGIKDNARWLQDLYKTYEEFKTYEQRRTTVMEREAQKRREIEANTSLTQEQKDTQLAASRKREAQELDTIDLEEFKASEDWIQTFENIDKVGTKSIEHLMVVLKEFIETNKDLTPEQLKTLMSEYEKLYQGLIARNPLKAITEGTKEYFAALKELRAARKDEGLQDARKEETAAQQEVKAARKDVKQADTDEDRAAASLRLAQAEERLAKAEKKRSDSENRVRKAQDKQRAALNKVQDGVNEAATAYNALNDVVSGVMETFNIDETSKLGVVLKSVSQALTMVAGVLGVINAMITLIETHPLVLAISAGIMAIIGAIMLFQNLKTAKSEKIIKEQEELLEKLEYQYKKLEKAAESAFGTEYLDNFKERLESLYQTQLAYEKQAQAERDKGKQADEEAIKDYENSARDTADEIAELEKEVSERMLGTDLGSAARDFADAWLEAYKTFGNTADAIGTKFREMIDNMVAESVIAGVMKSALDPVFKMIDNMTKDDLYDPKFWQNLGTAVESATENADVGATNAMRMLEAMGINIREMGQGLTGISKDIATASEESILGLAAGINTQNFYLSQLYAIALRMEARQGVESGVNIQDLITIQNQHLAHLPNIAANTAGTLQRCEEILGQVTDIATNLGRVIAPVGSPSTHQVHTTLS